MTQQLSTNTFGVAKWVVSADATQGTHTTIGAALTSASSGDTIYIRTGTYTENLTLKAGVNLCALPSESGINGATTTSANVIISGKCTFTAAGTVTISGIQLKTNSDFFLAVTGSAASIVNLYGCFLNCSNNTGISFTTSSSSAQINIYACTGDIALNSVTLATCTSPGQFEISYSDIESSAVTTTASTFNTTTLILEWSLVKFPITSTAASVSANFTEINSANTTAFTSVTSGTYVWNFCQFGGGTSSSISVGASTTVNIYNCIVASTNTNAITGSGTINYIGTAFSNTSTTVNTTTKTGVGLPTANGTSGQVLTSNGAGTIPTFQAASGAAQTYSPALAFGGSSTGITYTTQLGKYYQVGNLVFFDIFIVLSSKGAQTGAATLSLPVASASDNHNPAISLLLAGSINAFPTSTTQVTGYIGSGGSTITLWAQGSSTIANLTNTTFSNTTQIQCTGFYWTA